MCVCTLPALHRDICQPLAMDDGNVCRPNPTVYAGKQLPAPDPRLVVLP